MLMRFLLLQKQPPKNSKNHYLRIKLKADKKNVVFMAAVQPFFMDPKSKWLSCPVQKESIPAVKKYSFWSWTASW